MFERLKVGWSRVSPKWKALYGFQAAVSVYLVSQRIDWVQERKAEAEEDASRRESGAEQAALQAYLQRREAGLRKDLS